jgi:hypothetical protein
MRSRLLQKLSPLKLRGRPSGVGLFLLLACCSATDTQAESLPIRTSVTVASVFDAVITGQVKMSRGNHYLG